MWHTFFGYVSFISFCISHTFDDNFGERKLWNDMEFYFVGGWIDVLAIFQCKSIACEWTWTWSWSWVYEMNLTKGHNNLTKLNEKTSCICGKPFQTRNSYGSGWEFHITEELCFIFFVFFKINTPDIKHHVGEDHSNSFQPYHNPQQPRFEFCFFATHKFQG